MNNSVLKKSILLGLFCFGLAACGGTTSTSTSGDGAVDASVVGTYTGAASLNAVVTVDGDRQEATQKEPITLVVGSDGKVTISELGDDVVAVVNGNSFELQSSITQTLDGYMCSGSVDWQGAFVSGVANGSIDMALDCTGNGQVGSATVKGAFTATR